MEEYFQKIAALAEEGRAMFASEKDKMSGQTFSQAQVDEFISRATEEKDAETTAKLAEKDAEIQGLKEKVASYETTEAVQVAVQSAVEQNTKEIWADIDNAAVDNAAARDKWMAKFKKNEEQSSN